MKVRNGFVSNSSSSSFVAVFTRDGKIIEQFLDKFCPTREDRERIFEDRHKDFTDINYGILEHKPSGLHIHITYGNLYWIGLTIEDLLLQDKRLSECKQLVSEMLAQIGVDVSPKDLLFECDMCSSE